MSVRPLAPALAEKARIDFGENPELLEAKLRETKNWIATQPHLHARTDDQWLAAFLRGCKFKVDLVKTKLDLYYSLRSTTPDIYTLRYNDPRVKRVLEVGSAILLQNLKDPAAPRPYIIRFGSYDPRQWTIFNVLAVASLQMQVSFIEDDNITVSGLVCVLDVRNTRLSHYLQVPLKSVKFLVRAYQEALPMRIKEAHIIGSSYLFEGIINFAKRFLSDKINRRILLHSNLESLYEYLPKEILPAELGGTGPKLQEDIDYWKQKFDDYNDYFEDDLQYTTDESLRGKEKKSKTQS